MIARPAYQRHTTHFAESVALLFHASLHPHAYPWIRHIAELWLPTVSSAHDLDWNYEFLRIVLRAVQRFATTRQ